MNNILLNLYIRARYLERDERGSLALEQVLFIGAIVALSAGLFVFYDNLAEYFRNINFAAPPQDIGGRPNS